VTYEVELKFPLRDGPAMHERLKSLGATPGESLSQRDRYFNHPSRDFRQTNEALRIRSVGGQSCVTYKGPVLDREVKLRREIELPIGTTPAEGESFAEMLALLGFREVRSVAKTRRPFHLVWNDVPMELALDEIAGLGSFVEIETLADDANRDVRRAAVLDLAQHLGLGEPERRSYLKMLLEQDAAAGIATGDSVSK
jgi:adenylate cyclase, class 2